MDTHRLAGLGFLVTAVAHIGFVAVNLTIFGQPGYATFAGLLAVAALLAAAALRHGWEDHAPLLAWATVATAVASTLRWAVAELGQPLDATSPLALLLPVGAIMIASAAWSLWRGIRDPSGGRALRRLAVGAGLLALANLGFAAYALALGGIPIGLVLVVGLVGAVFTGWGAWRAFREAPSVPATRSRPIDAKA